MNTIYILHKGKFKEYTSDELSLEAMVDLITAENPGCSFLWSQTTHVEFVDCAERKKIGKT